MEYLYSVTRRYIPLSKDNNVDQEQIQNVKEAAEFQNQVIRESARLPDNQNRMITKHNRQMG